jgi:hypothetical protein
MITSVILCVRRLPEVILCVRRLPEDGIPVPKHLGAGTYHELCFMIFEFYCFVLSAFVG